MREEKERRREASKSLSRRRPVSRRGSSEEDERPPAYRSRSRGPTRASVKQPPVVPEGYSSEGSGSEVHTSDDEEQARTGLMRAASSPSRANVASDSGSDTGTVREKSLGRRRR